MSLDVAPSPEDPLAIGFDVVVLDGERVEQVVGSLDKVPELIGVPRVLETPRRVLNLLSTATVFGAPVAVTLSRLAIESVFPADVATLEQLAGVARDAAGNARAAGT